MIELLSESTLLFYALVLIISFLCTSLGLGTALFLIPVVALYFDPKETIGIVTIYGILLNINKMFFFRRHIRVNIGIKVIVYSVPGAILGSFALTFIPADIFKKMLAAIILFYLICEVCKLAPKAKDHEKAAVPIFGFLYGFLSGLVGTGRIIKGPLFTSLGLLKGAFIGTYAFTSFFVNVPKLITYYSTGIIDSSSFQRSIPFLFISIIATYTGSLFVEKIRSDVFYYILIVSFAASALMLFFG